MRRRSGRVLYGAALAITLVGVDLLLFKHHFGPRLAANIAIVLVFALLYWKFIKTKKGS